MSRARDIANYGDGIDATQITSGVFANARIQATNVTQHEGSIDALASNPTVTLGSNATFPAGHVIQYQSKNVTGNHNTSLGSFQHMSAYDLSITPLYTNSKIILNWSGNWYMNNDNRHGYFTIARGSTFLGHYITSTNGGEGLRLYMSANTGAHWQSVNVYHIDEPNTTSEITYKVYIRSSNTDTVYRINYSTQYFSNFSISEIKV